MTVVALESAGVADDSARRLWVEHYGALAGWCASLVGDVDVAHDIAAEAFTRLLGRWRSVHDPRGFLYVTATNLVRDHWRRESRDRKLVDRLGSNRFETVEQATDPWLRDLVERLPERLRLPVLLHYYADMPVNEVASAMRRPAGSVKRALFEGRALLAAMVEEQQ